MNTKVKAPALSGLALVTAAIAAGAMLNVHVRDGFVVAYTEKVDKVDRTTGEKTGVVLREQTYYPEDGPVQLPASVVKDHAHKLEPAGSPEDPDEDAAAFLEALHAKYQEVPTAPTAAIDPAALAAAVGATLAALGITPELLAKAAAQPKA